MRPIRPILALVLILGLALSAIAGAGSPRTVQPGAADEDVVRELWRSSCERGDAGRVPGLCQLAFGG